MLKFLTCLKRLVIMQNFYLYDSVKKNKILFEPIFPKRVTLYVCGPILMYRLIKKTTTQNMLIIVNKENVCSIENILKLGLKL